MRVSIELPTTSGQRETKATEEQTKEALSALEGYQIYAQGAARKKGYSGTAVLTKQEPLSVRFGIDMEQHDQEGRVITVEWPSFYLVNVYVPNSSSGLSRLPYRSREWDVDFLAYLKGLDQEKPVVLCGDLNVAHRPIDLTNPKANYDKNPGYTQAEIDGLDNMVAAGLVDSFRALNPELVKYSWWSYRAGARARNVGWRIDYFMVSERLMPQVTGAEILNDVLGSDHCPVTLEITAE